MFFLLALIASQAAPAMTPDQARLLEPRWSTERVECHRYLRWSYRRPFLVEDQDGDGLRDVAAARVQRKRCGADITRGDLVVHSGETLEFIGRLETPIGFHPAERHDYDSRGGWQLLSPLSYRRALGGVLAESPIEAADASVVARHANEVFFVDDHDGDGVPEVLARGSGEGDEDSFGLLSGRTGLPLWSRRVWRDGPWSWTFLVGDLSGDGLDDFALKVAEVDGADRLRVHASSTGEPVGWIEIPGTRVTRVEALGDLDGDGCDELLVRFAYGRDPDVLSSRTGTWMEVAGGWRLDWACLTDSRAPRLILGRSDPHTDDQRISEWTFAGIHDLNRFPVEERAWEPGDPIEVAVGPLWADDASEGPPWAFLAQSQELLAIRLGP